MQRYLITSDLHAPIIVRAESESHASEVCYGGWKLPDIEYRRGHPSRRIVPAALATVGVVGEPVYSRVRWNDLKN